MKQEFFSIFVELVSVKKLDQHQSKNEYFYNLVKELKSKHIKEKSHDWHCDTFCTQKFLHLEKDPVFSEILPDIKNSVLEFSKEYGVDIENHNIDMIDGWINLTPPNDYQEFHIHPGSHFSIVYYIKTPFNSGNLIFKNHETDKDMFPLPVSFSKFPSFKSFSFEPIENNLIIFKSNLSHMVEKNRSNDDRVSISCNFRLVNK